MKIIVLVCLASVIVSVHSDGNGLPNPAPVVSEPTRITLAGPAFTLEFGTVNAGARVFDDGGIGIIGHGLAGTMSNADYTMEVGAVSVLASALTPCPADLNGDGVVNAADLALLLGAWGPNPRHPADINENGVVNAADLALLLGAWGPCST